MLFLFPPVLKVSHTILCRLILKLFGYCLNIKSQNNLLDPVTAKNDINFQSVFAVLLKFGEGL